MFLLVFCFEESEIHADEITMETQELFDAVRLGSLTAVEKSLYEGADLSYSTGPHLWYLTLCQTQQCLE